ncbi:polysaccharide biosynthesis protein [Pleurocapsa sp. CCALA 161]|uniref:oligosaccharide flippase family protein n=1 Tax=Pleurocapsa sp. CCALA 161 TaxID=2107688 RepID=UPI000D05E47B|nr:oligosaccharide flippase family protein [Pleurocapsa sp. CCALA 161]PSB09427.1 polysaccharide biosynthesis protein [Pleurocapsa sp. CCALA 161]
MPKKKALAKIQQLVNSGRFKDSLALFQSFILQLIVQGIYFIILARTFAPEKYGAYVGIVAIVSVFIPFASWGSEQIIIQNVSRQRSAFREAWGTGILKTLVFGSIFISLILIGYSFFPIPGISLEIVFVVALANLIFLRLNDLVRDSFVGVGMLGYTAKIMFLLSLNRFVGVLVLIALFDHPSLLAWTNIYCFATFCSAVISTYLLVKQIDYPQFIFSKIKKDLKLGFSFAVGISAQTIYNDIDKSMLAKLSTLESAGIYGAAYHILSVSFTPILSLAMASFRNFFQQGVSGIKGSFALCKKLLPMSLGYSLIAVVGLAIFAPFVPLILGSEYADSATALLWLSPTIFFRTMYIFAADTLTGANLQKVRSGSQVLVAIVNAFLNFLLIPRYSWRGSIWATLIAECLLMVILWSAVYFYSRKSA